MRPKRLCQRLQRLWWSMQITCKCEDSKANHVAVHVKTSYAHTSSPQVCCNAQLLLFLVNSLLYLAALACTGAVTRIHAQESSKTLLVPAPAESHCELSRGPVGNSR